MPSRVKGLSHCLTCGEAKLAGAHLSVHDVVGVVVAPGRLPVPGIALPPVRHSRGAGPPMVVHGPHNSRGEPWMDTSRPLHSAQQGRIMGKESCAIYWGEAETGNWTRLITSSINYGMRCRIKGKVLKKRREEEEIMGWGLILELFTEK
ncbi:uncharacterized protein NPIL_312961 [Nephila pilipes]|uniref:Uncharacterized protein n=1 Tax=Nephila pilipes TaxID=299642 RepID=A0A8X6P5A9_NEPPI|nr:uncharacterized protein NPIL_312961 [Nephila pilipes]